MVLTSDVKYSIIIIGGENMNKLVTIAELQEYYGVSRQTIYDWRKLGLPEIKVSRVVRFDLDEVKTWVDARNK